MLCLNTSNIAIIIVKGVGYRCIIDNISKSTAIQFNQYYTDLNPLSLQLIYILCSIIIFQ